MFQWENGVFVCLFPSAQSSVSRPEPSQAKASSFDFPVRNFSVRGILGFAGGRNSLFGIDGEDSSFCAETVSIEFD